VALLAYSCACAQATAGVNGDGLSKITVAALRSKLKDAGLSTSGNKARHTIARTFVLGVWFSRSIHLAPGPWRYLVRRAPASTQAELVARLSASNGARASALDAASEQEATNTSASVDVGTNGDDDVVPGTQALGAIVTAEVRWATVESAKLPFSPLQHYRRRVF
jgi:hypothetical protein